MITIQDETVVIDCKTTEDLCLDVLKLDEALLELLPQELLVTAMEEALKRSGQDITIKHIDEEFTTQ